DNQRRLAQSFGVTLMTLRQALDVLAREGLITRRHGLGTFVAPPPVDYDILQFRTLAGDLSAVGEDVATRFLRSRFVRADRHVAHELGLNEDARIFVLERLRLVDGQPLSFQASHLPAAIGEEAAQADLTVTPLRHALSFKLGIEIAAARETVSAETLPARAARELGCAACPPSFPPHPLSPDPHAPP